MPDSKKNNKLINEQEFADRLGVSLITARSYRKKGLIKFIVLPSRISKMNRTIRYRESEVERFIKTLEREAVSAEDISQAEVA